MSLRNPFPGMNPFLEGSWLDVHTVLTGYIRDALAASLPDDLYARAEEQVIIDDGTAEPPKRYRADVAVSEDWGRGVPPVWQPEQVGASGPIEVAVPLVIEMEPLVERWIEIHEAGGRLVTVIEVLSPTNKLDPGRKDNLLKSHDYREAGVSVVEIDLLRCGDPVLPSEYLEMMRPVNGTRYLITVTRSWLSTHRREIYSCPLRDRLPAFRVPLRPTDPDIPLDLQPLIDRCYQNGRYWLTTPDQVPGPPLPVEDAAWVQERMAASA